jgi:hypothetical protein
MTTRVVTARHVYPASVDRGHSIPSSVSISSETGISVPSRSVEHPQPLSTTVQTGFLPVVPLNDSILAIGCPPECLPDPAADPA